MFNIIRTLIIIVYDPFKEKYSSGETRLLEENKNILKGILSF